ncbi:hypothetical protein BZG02_11785 [Labilibaculum filiforme]|uniref:Haloacid dehalogenase n=1 Tax=Labilibaculum filiforme TaxID=1940526 RepID=A0A2N3HXT4_9BACT|nr:HAD family phosphatase [Labilibaculum filiforme]PKQ62868.1 hypothetical protein BZG02_11785 [Labilibaculum filiforme]
MQKYNSIPNIIFDLGGVLLNIDTDQAVKSFKEIGLTDVNLVKKEYETNGLFDRLEKGMISADEFRCEIRAHMKSEVTDEQINKAWCSMLLDLPYERLDLLMKLKKNHRLFLLSNTSIIHWETFIKMIQEVHGLCFSDLFEKCYCSQDMGLRKPDPKIYTTVLEKEGLIASETLFIDDMLTNIEAAQLVGMRTHHLDLEKGERIVDLF